MALNHSPLEVEGDLRMFRCELGDECFELVSTLYRRGADQTADSICSCS
uniref:Uncharacterized protein n=1 Tax=Pseudomonas aeruginosa TaxID=287 RepID=A0A6H1Q8Z1_PSEAI|nr:hypothetical protein [Pseudomonas aeruginosa]